MLVFANEDDIDRNLAEMMREIFDHSQEFEAQGSGWTLDEVTLLQLHVVKYKPLAASSYIPTPKDLARTRSILNIQNKDNKCLVWNILAHFHPIDSKLHAAHVTNYLPHKHEINVKGVSFPTPYERCVQAGTAN